MITQAEYDDSVTRLLRSVTLGFGVLGVLAGLLLLIWPDATVTVLAVVLGLHFVVGGMITVAAAVAGPGGERALGVIVGVLALAAGVLTLARPLHTATVLFVIAAVFWVIRGVGDLVDALSGDHEGPRGLSVVAALVSLTAGIVVLVWPEVTLLVLVRVAGAWMLVMGLVRLAIGWSLRTA